MCGRYTLTSELAILQRRFGVAAEEIDFLPRYNIAPGQQAPVVVHEGTRQIRLMRWGLVPPWAKDPSSGYKMINARAETLDQKLSFQEAFLQRRCLVLADGFYEWRKGVSGQRKTPMRFVLKSQEPFSFAGLWQGWRGPDGDTLSSFTIITTAAEAWLRPIHDRMPLILPQEYEERWLDPHLKDVGKLKSILHPRPAKQMEGYDVSPIVNSPAHDGPECIQPVEGRKPAEV